MANGYDIFSQPQGPNISVSLFGDATAQGTATGNASPTKLTSALKGVVEGFEKGQDLILKQAEIAQIPIQNEIKLNAVKLQELAIQNESLELAEKTSLQLEEQQSKKATLIENIETLSKKRQVRQRTDEFYQLYKDGTDAQKAALVFGGQYNDVFDANKDMFKNTLTGLLGNTAITPQQREAIGTILRRSTALSADEKEARAKEKLFLDSKENMLEGKLTTFLSDKLQGPRESYPDKVELLPSGKWEKNPLDTTQYLKDADGQKIPVQGYDPKLNNYVDIVSRETGEILGEAWEEADTKLYPEYKVNRNLQRGDYGRAAADQLETEYQESQAKRQQSSPQSGQTNLAPPEKNKDLFTKSLAGAFSWDENTKLPLKTLGPKIVEFKDTLNNYINLPQRGVEAEATLADSKRNLARSISDLEFDSSPTLQEQITEADVTKHNESVDNSFVWERYNPLLRANSLARLNLFKVDSPKELYYLKRNDIIIGNITKAQNAMIKLINARKNQPIRQAAADALLQQSIASLTSGG